MRPSRSLSGARFFRLAAVLILVGLLAGCGYKTNPEPLRSPLPRAVKQFEIRQVGNAMRLSWIAPVKNQDGSLITNLDGFLIYRGVVSDDDQCSECGDTTNPLLKIGYEFPGPAFRNGKSFIFFDQELAENRAYRYRVTALNPNGSEGNPARIEKRFLTAPPPPTALTATGLDSLIRLIWSAPAATRPDFELIGYHLYKSDTAEGPLLDQLTTRPVTTTAFDDVRAKAGGTYRYAVRAVYRQEDTLLESAATRPAKATSRQRP